MTDSWWLKFKRAQRHMVEIRNEARDYAQSDPHKISYVREPHRNGDMRWTYSLAMDPPDPMIVVILGDFIHNLRSALDHVVVANSRAKDMYEANFPIFVTDPFAMDAQGNFIDPDNKPRERYLRAIRGLHFLHKTVVALCQPYNQTRAPSGAAFILRALSRLENADKHRQLIAHGGAYRGVRILVLLKGQPISRFAIRNDQFFYDRANIFSFFTRAHVKESEVEVKFTGTPAVNIQVTGEDGQPRIDDHPLIPTMLIALRTVRVLLKAMDGVNVRLSTGL